MIIPTLAMLLSMWGGMWIGVAVGRSGWSFEKWLNDYANRLEARIDERYRRNVERRQ